MEDTKVELAIFSNQTSYPEGLRQQSSHKTCYSQPSLPVRWAVAKGAHSLWERETIPGEGARARHYLNDGEWKIGDSETWSIIKCD